MRDFYADTNLAPYSRIPVYNDRREFIEGYVRRATVLEMLAQDRFAVTAGDIMRPILTFQESDKVADIWQRMLEKKEHISVIADEYGCMRGIVTVEDIIETMLGVEIVDECDTAEDLREVARNICA